jgi:hypothetical protein
MSSHDHVEIEEHRDPALRDLPITFGNLARIPLLAIIRLYQKTISRGIPADTCRFYPTCSHYGYQAIYKHGAIRGTWMATYRVLRCNPFNTGPAYDPVPEELGPMFHFGKHEKS